MVVGRLLGALLLALGAMKVLGSTAWSTGHAVAVVAELGIGLVLVVRPARASALSAALLGVVFAVWSALELRGIIAAPRYG